MNRSDSWKAEAQRRFAGAALIIVVGLVIGIVGSTLLGWVIVSLGLVIVVSLAFLEVGYSEERERDFRQAARGTRAGSLSKR